MNIRKRLVKKRRKFAMGNYIDFDFKMSLISTEEYNS